MLFSVRLNNAIALALIKMVLVANMIMNLIIPSGKLCSM